MFNKVSWIYIIIIAISIIMSSCACNRRSEVSLPVIPVEYYNCFAIEPKVMETIYFSADDLGDRGSIENLYNEKVFIFKDIVVEESVIRQLDKGWIWVSQIRCKLLNTDDMKPFNIGDNIDVVGVNMGYSVDGYPGLLFRDCIILPAGAVTFTAEQDPGMVVTFYEP